MQNTKKKILVIEDDYAIRHGVEYALRRAGYNVKSIADGSQALTAIEDFSPELIVLDIMLPGLDGHEITEALRKHDQETAIVMMSALGETDDRILGLSLGADDYLPKPFSMDELLARVEVNLRRVRKDTDDDEQPILVGDLRVDPQTREVHVDDKLIDLRSREFDLLYTLLKAGDKVLSREEIAEEVWGQMHLHSSRTIDVHIRRIRLLVEEVSAYTYIKTVHSVGYRIVVEKKA